MEDRACASCSSVALYSARCFQGAAVGRASPDRVVSHTWSAERRGRRDCAKFGSALALALLDIGLQLELSFCSAGRQESFLIHFSRTRSGRFCDSRSIFCAPVLIRKPARRRRPSRARSFWATAWPACSNLICSVRNRKTFAENRRGAPVAANALRSERLSIRRQPRKRRRGRRDRPRRE